MGYSADFRSVVINFIVEGHAVACAAQIFGVSPSTVRRWLRLQGIVKSNSYRDDLLRLNILVSQFPQLTLGQLGLYFGVNRMTIHYRLKKIKKCS